MFLSELFKIQNDKNYKIWTFLIFIHFSNVKFILGYFGNNNRNNLSQLFTFSPQTSDSIKEVFPLNNFQQSSGTKSDFFSYFPFQRRIWKMVAVNDFTQCYVNLGFLVIVLEEIDLENEG